MVGFLLGNSQHSIERRFSVACSFWTFISYPDSTCLSLWGVGLSTSAVIDTVSIMGIYLPPISTESSRIKMQFTHFHTHLIKRILIPSLDFPFTNQNYPPLESRRIVANNRNVTKYWRALWKHKSIFCSGESTKLLFSYVAVLHRSLMPTLLCDGLQISLFIIIEYSPE